MKIELKNFKHSEWNSEETNCFRADLFLNGKKVGYCNNEGHGGPTSYCGIEHHWSQSIKDMEEYCKTLPPIVYTKEKEGHDFTINMTLEHYIDDLVMEILDKKVQKKKEKEMLKYIVFSKSRWGYQTISWKGHTIESMLQSPLGRNTLEKKVKELQEQGYTIENTNLPFLKSNENVKS
jgi:hypothetical protein